MCVMMLKSGKDGVSYVLVFKLSRFIQRCWEAYDICSVSSGRD
jgi:hypothetical protein